MGNLIKDRLEEIDRQITELTRTVEEAHRDGDKSTLDMEALEAKLEALVEAKVAAEVEAKRPPEPARKGEPIGFVPNADGVINAVAAGDVALARKMREASYTTFEGRASSGKFAGASLSDLAFVHNFLQRAHELDPKGARPPSDYLSKLLTATGSGTGDEFVPTGMAAELWADMFLASRVVAAVGVVPMPTDPFDFPVGWGSITWRKGAAGEATAAQDPSTRKSTLTATEQIAEVNWNYDLDEDAVVAVLPTLRAELSRSGAEQIDSFALNADATATATGNINLDDDTPDADAYYLSLGQDGIRHYYLVDRTGQSTDITSTLDDAEWIAGRGRMGKYGVDPDQVAVFCNVKTYLQSILGLTNVRTVDKYGPLATILTGELARVDGIPVIPSASIALAEDDGKVSATAGNNDEGQIAFVHRPSWRVGFRRELLIEIDRDIRKRMFIMVVSFRIAIAARDNGNSTARSDDHTAGVHGITY